MIRSIRIRRKFLWSCIFILFLPFSLSYGKDQNILKVGTSGDYAPYSVKISDNLYEGFDPAIAQLYAEDKGRTIEWVPFQWPHLDEALKRNDFDIAMSGVTISPSHSIAGEFTIPVATMEAVVLVKESNHFNNIEVLNDKSVKLGVNAGGYLEQVARQQFPDATIITFSENYAVPQALQKGKVDGAITETQEAQFWGAGTSGINLLGPFTHDKKAYLVPLGESDLVVDFNQWLLDREADGTLAKLRSEYFDESAGPNTETATPLMALLASINERLALMDVVAKIKYAQGIPVQVPEQEEQVIAAAITSTKSMAEAKGICPPAEAAVQSLIRAQIEAAKEIQNAELIELERLSKDRDQQSQIQSPLYDLDKDIRPAIIRIDNKMISLILILPPKLEYKDVLTKTRNNLQTLGLDDAHIEDIATAIVKISKQVGPKFNRECYSMVRVNNRSY